LILLTDRSVCCALSMADCAAEDNALLNVLSAAVRARDASDRADDSERDEDSERLELLSEEDSRWLEDDSRWLEDDSRRELSEVADSEREERAEEPSELSGRRLDSSEDEAELAEREEDDPADCEMELSNLDICAEMEDDDVAEALLEPEPDRREADNSEMAEELSLERDWLTLPLELWRTLAIVEASLLALCEPSEREDSEIAEARTEADT